MRARLAVVLIALLPAHALAQAATTPVEAIRAAALAGLGLAPGQGEAVVDRQLRLAACAQPLVGTPRNARTAEVRCPDTPGWRLFVPVRAVAGTRAIAGTPVAGGIPTPTGAGLQAQAPLADTAAVPAFTVRRGDPVVIVARLGTSEVRMAGRALGSPGPGGTVAVQNASSQRVLRGRLVGDGLVEVH